MKKIITGLFFTILALSTYASNDKLADLMVHDSNSSLGGCSPSLQNCTIQISSNGCLIPNGAITITNTSRVVARNIAASSSDPNYNTYVVQENGCPSSLAPGGSCAISFYTTITYALFTVPNVVVKGTNTSTTLFNINAVQCAHTLGGTISGLVGSVSLQNNSGDTLTRSTNGSFTFNTPVAEGASYFVSVSSQPLTQTCTVSNGVGIMGNSNITNVQVNCATNTTTLSVDTTGTIPVNSGSGSITITNTGATETATNVSVTLPSGWTNVIQNASNCASIAPGNSCNITFTSTTPYIAEGNIPVVGDNISNTPTTALAFTVQGYLVWEVTNASTVQVVDNSDISSSEQWGNSPLTTGAVSLTDGFGNTGIINGTGGIGTSAAVSCYNSTNGGALAGTWYLPAICQMGGAGQLAGCASGLANIDTNLAQLGFGGFTSGPSSSFWSSTEQSNFNAWMQYYVSLGNSSQTNTGKASLFTVRCARSLTY